MTQQPCDGCPFAGCYCPWDGRTLTLFQLDRYHWAKENPRNADTSRGSAHWEGVDNHMIPKPTPEHGDN